MTRLPHHLPLVLTALLTVAALLYGPLAQLVQRTSTKLQNPRAPLAADTAAVAPSRHRTPHH